MIILASNSPRRRELLAHITRDFTVQGTDVDESLPAGIAPAARCGLAASLLLAGPVSAARPLWFLRA